MPAPEIPYHGSRGEQIAEKHRWPGERAKHWLREKKRGTDEAELKDDKE
jgi:hypothetical protein